MFYQKPLNIILLLVLFSFTHLAYSSSIVVSSGQSKQIKFYHLPGNKSDDFLNLAPANAYGISVNRFSRFEIKDKALKLMNVKSRNGNSDIPSASIIVIVADHIELSGQVQILGDLADLVFISTSSNGTVSCTACNIENVYRVGLIVGNLLSDNLSN